MKIISKRCLIGATFLVLPFSAQAAELNIDDIYLFESSSAYDTPKAPAQQIQKSDVRSGEMYAFEQRDTYEFDTLLTTSTERVEMAVFSEVIDEPQGHLPSYTGEYD